METACDEDSCGGVGAVVRMVMIMHMVNVAVAAVVRVLMFTYGGNL